MHSITSGIFRTMLLLFMFMFLVCTSALAAPSVTINYAGNGVFTIFGNDLVDAGGFDIKVRYDQSALANPRVDKGTLIASAMMVPNTSLPGQVNIAAMLTQGVSGKGVLATITFDVKGASQAAIIGMDVNLGSAKGVPIQVAKAVNNPPDLSGSVQQDPTNPANTAATTGTTSSSTSTSNSSAVSSTGAYIVSGSQAQGGQSVNVTTSGGSTVSIASVTPPTDQFASSNKGEELQTLYTDLRKDLAGKAKEGEEKSKDESKDDKAVDKYVTFNGALPQFRKFTGEKTPTALMLLFAVQDIAGFKQEPQILLADGKESVKLSISSNLLGKETPSFAVSSAKILSLAPGEDGSWTLVVQPKKGVVDSVLSISSGTGGADIPLLVAPIIDPNISKSGKLSEADFALFLKETGTPKAPKFDLNGDGKRDYLDDYIFTANYLVKMKIKPESLKPKETDQKAKESGKKPEKTEGKGQPESPAAKGTKPAETIPALPEKKVTPKEVK